jgi:ubiquitin carboxyl-terminal hydrolase 9/24
MEQALSAHIKILDYSCSQTQDRDKLKLHWVDICITELRQGVWVIPALKQIKAICELFYEGCGQVSSPHVLYRNNVVENIQTNFSVVSLVADSLDTYMSEIRQIHKNEPSKLPEDLLLDKRCNHTQQIQERLDFLRFILNDGKMWLCEPQAEQIWICLANNHVFPVDREVCFKWFSEVMGDDTDLDPEITKRFFEKNVLKINPRSLNSEGLRCFERFFKFVNKKEGHLTKKRNGTYVLEDTNLIGFDYLWKVIIESQTDIANCAIELLKEIYSNLGCHLRPRQSEIHNLFITSCSERLHASQAYLNEAVNSLQRNEERILEEARKITLCLKTLKEYIIEAASKYPTERAWPPHKRSCRGKQVCLYIRFSPQNNRFDDFDLWSHTKESMASVRRQINLRYKLPAQTIKIDIYNNGELLNPSDDCKMIGDSNLKDRTVLTVKAAQIGGSAPSSPDSSSDSSQPPLPNSADGPNLEAEKALPGVILSHMKFASSLFELGDLGIKFRVPELRDIALNLLEIIPCDTDVITNIKLICSDLAQKGSKSSMSLEKLFFTNSPMQVLYYLEVVYALRLPSTDQLEQHF